MAEIFWFPLMQDFSLIGHLLGLKAPNSWMMRWSGDLNVVSFGARVLNNSAICNTARPGTALLAIDCMLAVSRHLLVSAVCRAPGIWYRNQIQISNSVWTLIVFWIGSYQCSTTSYRLSRSQMLLEVSILIPNDGKLFNMYLSSTERRTVTLGGYFCLMAGSVWRKKIVESRSHCITLLDIKNILQLKIISIEISSLFGALKSQLALYLGSISFYQLARAHYQ